LKLYASHPKSLSGLDVSWNVINVHGLLSLDFESAKGLAKDKRIGLAGADGTGVDARWKELEKGVVSFEMLDVDGVSIGEKG
jgi:hypothetical protein